MSFGATPATAGPGKGATRAEKKTTQGAAHSKGKTSGGHKAGTALVNAFNNLALGATIHKGRARKPGKKKAKFSDKSWVTINPDPGGPGSTILYLCKGTGKKPPTECQDPGTRPPEPPGGFTPACVFCDPSDKEGLYNDWLDKQLAADALHGLLQIMKKGQYWGKVGGMFSDMYDALSALSGPGSVAFKAAKWGMGELLGAATDAAKEKAMEAFLDGVLDALGLDLDPDDLTTEAGLVAAIALADGIAGDAYADYRAALLLWAKCRSDAVGSGMMPTNTQADADACNDTAQAAQNAAAQAAWDAIFAWEASAMAYDACLEYNADLDFETSYYQSTPC